MQSHRTFIYYTSNRIHKGALDAAEQNQAEEENQQADAPAQKIVPEIEVAKAKHRITECRDDRRDRVEQIKSQPLLRHEPQAVGNRAAVLPELQAEANQHGKIAVFGGDRGDDDAAADGEHHHVQHLHRHQKKHGRHADACPAPDDKEQPEAEKHGKLDAEGDQIGQGRRDRRDQTGIVDLAHRGAVIEKGVGGGMQRGREIRPADIARHVEQKAGQDEVALYVRGGQVREVPEDDGEHHRRQQRLHDRPGRAEDRLLVHGGKVTLDKQENQVTVLKGLFEMQVKETVSG